MANRPDEGSAAAPNSDATVSMSEPASTDGSPVRRPRVAILIVNGFARKGRWSRPDLSNALTYPWIEPCLKQIERHSRGWDYEIFVFDNSHLKQHRALMRAHPSVHVFPSGLAALLGRAIRRIPMARPRRALEYLVQRPHPLALDYLAARVPAEFDYIVTLDTDSFPVRDDWLDVLVSECEKGAAVAGVYREEMAPKINPFVHVSGLCIKRQELRELEVSFGKDLQRGDEYNQEPGQKITYELLRRGRTIAPLKRSNEVNYHWVIGGIYGDVIYHQGAGSRNAIFHTSNDRRNDERIGAMLRDAAFEDLDHLIAVLRGQATDDLSASSQQS